MRRTVVIVGAFAYAFVAMFLWFAVLTKKDGTAMLIPHDRLALMLGGQNGYKCKDVACLPTGCSDLVGEWCSRNGDTTKCWKIIKSDYARCLDPVAGWTCSETSSTNCAQIKGGDEYPPGSGLCPESSCGYSIRNCGAVFYNCTDEYTGS